MAIVQVASSFESLSPATVAGDLIVEGGTGDVRLPAGALGQVLQMGAAIPAWVALAVVPTSVATKTGAYTLTASDAVILADATGGGFTLTLPTAVGITGHLFHIKKIDATANAVTVDGNGAETLDGAATLTISEQHQSFTLVSDGAVWRLI